MSDITIINVIKDEWNRNRLGVGTFIVGTILCITGEILAIIWKLNFTSFSDNTPYIVLIVGIGIPFILVGINIMLKYSKRYEIVYSSHFEKLECMLAIILILMFFRSYPDGWNYPIFYITIIPYVACIFLLVINIFFNMHNKEIEMAHLRKELEDSNIIIKEKDEMCKDSSAPDYVAMFANALKENIDELIKIMDDFKTGIDIGTKDIAERTAYVANKYRSDNEQLHNDVQKFRQRVEKEKIEFKERSNERMIKNLMNILYSIDELKQYRDKDTNYTVGDIDHIKDDIYEILKAEDIEIINPPIGDDFDDKKCCAIQTIETDKFPEKKIVDIKKIGYMFKSGKVIRYADVIVSKNNIKIANDIQVDTKINLK